MAVPRAPEPRPPELLTETPGPPVHLVGASAGEPPMRSPVGRGALLVSLPAGPLPGILGGAAPEADHSAAA